MGLREYIRRRRFDSTPEPRTPKHPSHQKLRFVVQQHHARHMHYDFRLELDGVLKSWAVPKGPSLNPHDHHLAVQTEDHPYSYRTFEGVIPKDNYGAGKVIIWDEGWYEARKGSPKDSAKTLRSELKKGHLTFILHGHKLKGEFALIKMPRASEDNAWLLVKKDDEHASSADITSQDTSVKSHKTVEQIGEPLPDLSTLPRVEKPWQATPMFCTLANEPFDDPSWLFEIKWDGYRALASRHSGDVMLYSRNNLNFASTYPPITEAIRRLPHNCLLDGEIVAVDTAGVSHFEWLQNWPRDQEGDLQYRAFDLLWYEGKDLRDLPLIERKALLHSLLPDSSPILYSDHITGKGRELFHEMQRRELEGIIAKRANSPYREGSRGPDWLKIKTHQRQEVVIGGYTEPRGSRKHIGSLLVGVYENNQFIYVGHSGGGITDQQRKQLQQQLAKLARQTSPFAVEPKPNAPAHWVSPKLVCEMSFSEWTADGRMRHPKFEGLRPDKNPSEVHREQPAATPAATSTPGALPFEPTHRDKIFFPKHRYTKGDLFDYYQAAAPFILPYLKDRPLSLNRMPGGITGESFFQKNNPHLPAWVPHADIFSESNGGDLRWIVGGTLETLLYIVQLGSVEINPWSSRVGQLDRPDWMVIDLDPDGARFDTVINIARTVKDVCDEWGIASHPKTSGKTGLHIYVPLEARYNFEQARTLAHLIAIEVNKRQPKITSIERNPAKRRGKLYLDYLQNRAGQTLAAPYSVRPTPDATVSMPLDWSEVKPGLRPTDFTIRNALARMRAMGDIWKPVASKGIDLDKVLRRIESSN